MISSQTEFYSTLSDMPDIYACLKTASLPVYLYGMGNGADKLLDRCSKENISISGVFASDGFVRGQEYRGMKVRSYSDIVSENAEFIILLAFGSRKPDVLARLEALDHRHVLYIPDMPLAGEEWISPAFVKEHLKEIQEAENLFKDEASVALYRRLWRYKLTGAFKDLGAATYPADDTTLTSFRKEEWMVDAGAYTGDTIRLFSQKYPQCRHYIAIEPDPKTARKLCAFAEEKSNVWETICVNAAVGESDGSIRMNASGNRNSNTEKGSYQNNKIVCPLCTIDQLCQNRKIGYIKYDVEGMEEAALKGSIQTFHATRPALRVSVYHRTCDLFRLPLFCASFAKKCRFYLRRNRCVPAWETDLYVIPEERMRSC